jgi:hypothetical protein
MDDRESQTQFSRKEVQKREGEDQLQRPDLRYMIWRILRLCVRNCPVRLSRGVHLRAVLIQVMRTDGAILTHKNASHLLCLPTRNVRRDTTRRRIKLPFISNATDSWRQPYILKNKMSSAPKFLYSGLAQEIRRDFTKVVKERRDDGQIQNELPMPAAPEGRILVAEDSALYIFLEDPESRSGYLVSTDFNLSHVRWIQKSDRAWSSEWPRIWYGLLLAGKLPRRVRRASNLRRGASMVGQTEGVPQHWHRWRSRTNLCRRTGRDSLCVLTTG